MRMRAKSGSHMVDLLFTLALFCVFAASALMVVLIGANVYKNTVRQMEQSFAGRSSLTYVATKIRQNDTADSIHIEDLTGSPALVLNQIVDGETYQTWIYYCDGAVRETFTVRGNTFDPYSGQAIIEVAGFSVEQEGNLLRFTTVDADGNSATQLVAPRSGIR